MEFNEKNTVKVDFGTMEQLVRDSERLATVKDFVNKSKHLGNEYVDLKALQVLLGTEGGDK